MCSLIFVVCREVGRQIDYNPCREPVLFCLIFIIFIYLQSYIGQNGSFFFFFITLPGSQEDFLMST